MKMNHQKEAKRPIKSQFIEGIAIKPFKWDDQVKTFAREVSKWAAMLDIEIKPSLIQLMWVRYLEYGGPLPIEENNNE